MNLLEDSVLTVRTSTGHERCSLPRIYHLLQNDEVEGFSKLQAHQKQAWHCFLAQLGAIATEDRAMPASEEEWRAALLDGTERAAWSLHTANLNKPAFMQPPVSEETLDDFSEIHPTEYDVPVLSKSHALKLHRMHDPDPEHWVYLLVNVQTTGFYSPGGRRASRMNGSYASRPFYGLTPSLRLGPWIMHDIDVLTTHVGDIEERYGFKRSVTPLLWTEPWDGTRSFDLTELHPLYIDCARRIRKGDTWMKKTTSTERVTGDINGQTGDPWAPVDTTEDKVLNPRRAAFEYRQLARILFSGDYRRPISFRGPTDGYVVCRAVTGEQGGRVHNLQRVIPFSNAESDLPFSTPDESQVAEEAQSRVQKAETAAEIFSHALYLLLKDDRDDGKTERVPDLLQDGRNRQMRAFHERVDQHFFDRLFRAPDLSDEERSTFWETTLVRALKEQMAEAVALGPDKNYWERRARAQSTFDDRIKSTFTYATPIASTHDHVDSKHDDERHVAEPDARAVADVQ